MKRSVFTILILLVTVAIAAQTPEAAIEKGNKAYSLGRYDIAIQSYEQVVKQGYESAHLYYNLGNAYFKNNELPLAILYYEKALKLDPNNPDTKYNLAVANSRITDKIEKIPELFLKRWWRGFWDLFSSDTLAMLVVIFALAGLLLSGVYLVSRRNIIRRIAFWSALPLLVFAFIMLGMSFHKRQQTVNHAEGIVFTPTVTVKSSPDPSSIDLFVLHEGSKVVVQDSIGGWIEVKIANGSQGWIQLADIRKI
ncbi:MAG TPA: tetratricopeptide repeat protein [Bacteroidales bacterium]|jgi:tetratricopeptide (TPR) repeat protein|nr:tetratricopeptide repeat protein [Bacteroidales bacterium]